MTKEEKNFLLKDFCVRLPYKLFCQTDDGKGKLISVECSTGEDLVYIDFGHQEAEEYDLNEGDTVKPYLCPMSSMTEEELKEYKHLVAFSGSPNGASNFVDWLNAHHFDYRGLIQKGLALEAPEGMYEN